MNVQLPEDCSDYFPQGKAKKMKENARLLLVISLLTIVVTGVYATWSGWTPLTSQRLETSLGLQATTSTPIAQILQTPVEAPSSDPALRNPFFASLAREHGKDWEKDLHPQLRLWLDWQRKIGKHALITGFGVGNPDLASAESKFVISVTEWDGSDLFELGLPHTYNGKDVEIIKMGFAVAL